MLSITRKATRERKIRKARKKKRNRKKVGASSVSLLRTRKTAVRMGHGIDLHISPSRGTQVPTGHSRDNNRT
jgi:hypothetical protein